MKSYRVPKAIPQVKEKKNQALYITKPMTATGLQSLPLCLLPHNQVTSAFLLLEKSFASCPSSASRLRFYYWLLSEPHWPQRSMQCDSDNLSDSFQTDLQHAKSFASCPSSASRLRFYYWLLSEPRWLCHNDQCSVIPIIFPILSRQ
jgi:hypothetical protein